MRLINPNDMVRALQSNTVRSWEYFIYGAIWILGCALNLWVWYISDYTSVLLGRIDLALLLGILCGGTFFSWYINKKGDGKFFLKRYISIDMSLFFSATVFTVITYFLYSLTRTIISENTYFEKMLIDTPDVIYSTIAGLVFLAWSLVLMRKVSTKSRQ